jgi:translation initiation factor 4E
VLAVAHHVLRGEELNNRDKICSAVISLRSKVKHIQLWMHSKDDVKKVNSVGCKLVKLLDMSGADGIELEFQVTEVSSQGQSQ